MKLTWKRTADHERRWDGVQETFRLYIDGEDSKITLMVTIEDEETLSEWYYEYVNLSYERTTFTSRTAKRRALRAGMLDEADHSALVSIGHYEKELAKIHERIDRMKRARAVIARLKDNRGDE